jgi:hypothetical protein
LRGIPGFDGANRRGKQVSGARHIKRLAAENRAFVARDRDAAQMSGQALVQAKQAMQADVRGLHQDRSHRPQHDAVFHMLANDVRNDRSHSVQHAQTSLCSLRHMGKCTGPHARRTIAGDLKQP